MGLHCPVWVRFNCSGQGCTAADESHPFRTQPWLHLPGALQNRANSAAPPFSWWHAYLLFPSCCIPCGLSRHSRPASGPSHPTAELVLHVSKDSLQGCGLWEGEQESNQNVFLEDVGGRCLPGLPNPAFRRLFTLPAGSSHLEMGVRNPENSSAPS